MVTHSSAPPLRVGAALCASSLHWCLSCSRPLNIIDPLPALPPAPCALPLNAAWIKRQQVAGQAPCSPLTNLPLPHLALVPSNLVRSMIASMRAGGLLR